MTSCPKSNLASLKKWRFRVGVEISCALLEFARLAWLGPPSVVGTHVRLLAKRGRVSKKTAYQKCKKPLHLAKRLTWTPAIKGAVETRARTVGASLQSPSIAGTHVKLLAKRV